MQARDGEFWEQKLTNGLREKDRPCLEREPKQLNLTLSVGCFDRGDWEGKRVNQC